MGKILIICLLACSLVFTNSATLENTDTADKSEQEFVRIENNYPKYDEVTPIDVITDETNSVDSITLEVEVTAYTAGYTCTGKTPSHPLYGVTASGAYVEEGTTIAAPREFPIGTEIYIPNYGRGLVQDRGSAVRWTGQRYVLDIYIQDYQQALRWGRRVLEVEVFLDNLETEDIEKILRLR